MQIASRSVLASAILIQLFSAILLPKAGSGLQPGSSRDFLTDAPSGEPTQLSSVQSQKLGPTSSDGELSGSFTARLNAGASGQPTHRSPGFPLLPLLLVASQDSASDL